MLLLSAQDGPDFNCYLECWSLCRRNAPTMLPPPMAPKDLTASAGVSGAAAGSLHSRLLGNWIRWCDGAEK